MVCDKMYKQSSRKDTMSKQDLSVAEKAMEAPVATTQVPRKRFNGLTKATLSAAVLFGAAALILSAVSFYAGVQYRHHQSEPNRFMQGRGLPDRDDFRGGMMNRRGPMGMHGMYGVSIGEATVVSGTGITVTPTGGETPTSFTISEETTISRDGRLGGVSDIHTGDTVMVVAGSSDSKLASRIIIDPPSTMSGDRGTVYRERESASTV